MNHIARQLGQWLGAWLSQPQNVDGASPAPNPVLLEAALQPGDVLLIEGTSRFSTAIKYLTQSTWTHAALYVGNEFARRSPSGESLCFVEADVMEGVRMTALSEYTPYHSRICRAVGLTPAHRRQLIEFVLARVGYRYDMRNVFDLMRYMVPLPIPQRLRRRALAFGSGDPTRAICSTLIAQAFQSIRYPILPASGYHPGHDATHPHGAAERFRIRHYSLYVPRDFDVSPYFQIVKPTLLRGFDYLLLPWDESKDTAAITVEAAKA